MKPLLLDRRLPAPMTKQSTRLPCHSSRKVERHSLPRPQKSVLFDLYAFPIEPPFGRFQGDEKMASRSELAVNRLHQFLHSIECRVVNDVVRDHQIKEAVQMRNFSHVLLDDCGG